jgi:hypothetical protein
VHGDVRTPVGDGLLDLGDEQPLAADRRERTLVLVSPRLDGNDGDLETGMGVTQSAGDSLGLPQREGRGPARDADLVQGSSESPKSSCSAVR